jgi:hypothetical protein
MKNMFIIFIESKTGYGSQDNEIYPSCNNSYEKNILVLKLQA